jgi:hypothetical protein
MAAEVVVAAWRPRKTGPAVEAGAVVEESFSGRGGGRFKIPRSAVDEVV